MAPIPHTNRVRARALSVAERAAILDGFYNERFVDFSPTEVWAALLDEGCHSVSISTRYQMLDNPATAGIAADRPPTRQRSNLKWSRSSRIRSGVGISPSCGARQSRPGTFSS